MKNRLKVLRAERSWSQQKLAEELGVSRQSVNAIETGRYDPSLPLAFQIADDLLDATASAEELGKNPSDAALDKTTYVAVHGLEDAAARARAEVARARAALAGADGVDLLLTDVMMPGGMSGPARRRAKL